MKTLCRSSNGAHMYFKIKFKWAMSAFVSEDRQFYSSLNISGGFQIPNYQLPNYQLPKASMSQNMAVPNSAGSRCRNTVYRHDRALRDYASHPNLTFSCTSHPSGYALTIVKTTFCIKRDVQVTCVDFVCPVLPAHCHSYTSFCIVFGAFIPTSLNNWVVLVLCLFFCCTI